MKIAAHLRSIEHQIHFIPFSRADLWPLSSGLWAELNEGSADVWLKAVYAALLQKPHRRRFQLDLWPAVPLMNTRCFNHSEMLLITDAFINKLIICFMNSGEFCTERSFWLVHRFVWESNAPWFILAPLGGFMRICTLWIPRYAARTH